MAEDTKTATAAAAPASKPAAAAGTKPAEAKAAKPKAAPKPPRFDPKATIHFLQAPLAKDAKEGEKAKTYGPTNSDTTVNPKREGTQAHTAFSLYKEGATVDEVSKAFEAKKITGFNGDLAWNIGHKFIELVPAKA